MSHADRLWELLLPLGPYSRQGAYTAGELAGEGNALDGVQAALEDLEQEVFLDSAETYGLDYLECLLVHKPVTQNAAQRRAALSALLRIGGDSFTLAAINDNLRGCGINAQVSETAEQGVVEVRFPDVPGVPEGFDRLKKIIEDILPVHLQIRYVYWYITWQFMEDRFGTWAALEQNQYSWDALERSVS